MYYYWNGRLIKQGQTIFSFTFPAASSTLTFSAPPSELPTSPRPVIARHVCGIITGIMQRDINSQTSRYRGTPACGVINTHFTLRKTIKGCKFCSIFHVLNFVVHVSGFSPCGSAFNLIRNVIYNFSG